MIPSPPHPQDGMIIMKWVPLSVWNDPLPSPPARCHDAKWALSRWHEVEWSPVSAKMRSDLALKIGCNNRIVITTRRGLVFWGRFEDLKRICGCWFFWLTDGQYKWSRLNFQTRLIILWEHPRFGWRNRSIQMNKLRERFNIVLIKVQ